MCLHIIVLNGGNVRGTMNGRMNERNQHIFYVITGLLEFKQKFRNS